MKAFEVSEESCDEFVCRVSQQLKVREMDDVVRVERDGDRIVVRFSYLGRSSISFRVCERNKGFQAYLERAMVSPLHAAFRRQADAHLEKIMADLGATILDE